MANMIPKFCEISFYFENPSDIPEHIEEYPETPNYPNCYSIFGWSGGERTYPLATDIPDLSIANILASARAAKEEKEIGLYRHTNDVYINHPDGTNERVYFGRSL